MMKSVAIVLLVGVNLALGLVPIIVDLIPMSNNNRPGTFLSGTRYITVHNTANTSPGADAEAHANYVKNPSTAVSWHFTVDDHEIYQHLPTNEVGWHAGTSAGNAQSVGIEICENSDGNFAQAVRNSQELVAKLMGDLNVPLSRVVTHQSWSGKNCPSRLISTWQDYLNGIGGSDPSKCYGTVTADSLNIRSAPDAGSVIVGSLPGGAYVELLNRVNGTPVSGNSFWFQVSGGYVSAFYINVSSGSSQAWCRNN